VPPPREARHRLQIAVEIAGGRAWRRSTRPSAPRESARRVLIGVRQPMTGHHSAARRYRCQKRLQGASGASMCVASPRHANPQGRRQVSAPGLWTPSSKLASKGCAGAAGVTAQPRGISTWVGRCARRRTGQRSPLERSAWISGGLIAIWPMLTRRKMSRQMIALNVGSKRRRLGMGVTFTQRYRYWSIR